MTTLVLIGLFAVAAVGTLVLGLRAPPAADTVAARRAQLHTSLAELARAKREGMLDAASFADERQRIEAELAVLAPDDAPVPAAVAPARTSWPVAIAAMVLLPAAAVGIYVTLQGGFWQQLQANPAASGAPPVDPAAMVARLEARLAKDGSDPEGWRRLGRAYVVLGRPADARQAYGRAAALAPDDLTLLEGYADAAEAGVPPPPGIAAMLARVEQGIVDTPDDPRAWVRAGFARSLQGNRSGGRDAYARAYALDPTRPEVLAAYAASEYALDPQRPSARAVELYEKVLTINPNNGSALWVLGQAAQLRGASAQARDYWQRLLALLPEDSATRAQVQRAIDQATGPATGPAAQ